MFEKVDRLMKQAGIDSGLIQKYGPLKLSDLMWLCDMREKEIIKLKARVKELEDKVNAAVNCPDRGG